MFTEKDGSLAAQPMLFSYLIIEETLKTDILVKPVVIIVYINSVKLFHFSIESRLVL